MAAGVLVLLATAFLPILGIEFAWVDIHWATGLVLVVLVALHTVRSLLFRPLRVIVPDLRDARDTVAVLRFNVGMTREAPPLPGKYSVSQKGIHAALAVAIVTALVTGCLMMFRVDSPLWERDPYFLSDDTWGVVYTLHGFSALTLITLVMVHVYFSLRPEKRHYLLSMITGSLTQADYEKFHDPVRWSPGDE